MPLIIISIPGKANFKLETGKPMSKHLTVWSAPHKYRYLAKILFCMFWLLIHTNMKFEIFFFFTLSKMQLQHRENINNRKQQHHNPFCSCRLCFSVMKLHHLLQLYKSVYDLQWMDVSTDTFRRSTGPDRCYGEKKKKSHHIKNLLPQPQPTLKFTTELHLHDRLKHPRLVCPVSPTVSTGQTITTMVCLNFSTSSELFLPCCFHRIYLFREIFMLIQKENKGYQSN